MSIRLKSGDKVKVLSGKDRGKTGKILQIFTKLNRASVEGVNVMVKHLRKNREGQKGQKVQFPAPFSMDRLMLVCPRCDKPTRVGLKVLENKKRARVCKKCKETI